MSHVYRRMARPIGPPYVCNAASDWPHTFLHPKCFCLALVIHVATGLQTVHDAHY